MSGTPQVRASLRLGRSAYSLVTNFLPSGRYPALLAALARQVE
ncbi:MAG: hypothetical protein U9Q82_12395 [Chloroflexota bacterium]|nr:hypothetical protein [Chloroflexota bacterium]